MQKILEPLRLLIRLFRYKVWCLDGRERLTKENLSIIFVGKNRSKNFLKYLAFETPPKETDCGHIWLWNLLNLNSKKYADYPIVMIELRRPVFRILRKSYGFYIPDWLAGEFDFSTTKNQIKKNKGVKNDVRIIRKYGLTYEISKDPQTFHYYYHHMYLPYIKNKYGEAAAMMGYDKLMKNPNRSELLLIKMNDEYVAAENHLYKGNHVKVWSLGVKDGNLDLLRYGVIGALYYFRYKHLHKKGFKRIDAGLTRAFIKDGALRYKKKWGMEVINTKAGGFWLWLRKPSCGVKSFLKNNPFIFEQKGELHRAVFLKDIKELNEDRLAELNHRHRVPGTSALHLFLFDSTQKDISTFDIQGETIHISSAQNLFKSYG